MSSVVDHWNALRLQPGVTNRPLQLLIGDNADGACAARILMRLLRGNHVPFDAHVVMRPQQVTQIAADNQNNAFDAETEKDTYVFVGCGATIDVPALLPMDGIHKAFIIDAQRPMHLANMRDDRVVVWDGAAVSTAIGKFFAHHNRKVVSRAARQRRDRTRSSRRAGSSRKPKQHRGEAGDDAEEGDAHVDSDGEPLEDDGSETDLSSADDEEQPTSSDEDDLSEVDPEDLELGDGRRIDWLVGTVPPRLERLYYSASWCDVPAAMMMFDLAADIRQLHESITWNASVGCADILRRRGCSVSAYHVHYLKLADAVNQAVAARRTLMLGDITNTTADNEGRSACSWRLTVTTDFCLFCLNHTSLQAALELDATLAAKLRVHRSSSDRNNNLAELLAHAGISHATARRAWCELSSDDRAVYTQRLGAELVRLGFADASFQLTRPVVSRAVGFSPAVSPFDACALFYAELSRAPAKTALKDADSIHEHLRRQFWTACDVLDASPQTKAFGDALDEAMNAAEVVTQATAELIQPGGLVMAHELNYALLGARGGRSERALAHPARLRQLADHVVEALSVETRRHERRPILIGCPALSPDDAVVSEAAEQLVVCSVPGTWGPLDVVPAVGEIAAARYDFDDGIASGDYIDPLATAVRGATNAANYLEAVHLRLAR